MYTFILSDVIQRAELSNIMHNYKGKSQLTRWKSEQMMKREISSLITCELYQQVFCAWIVFLADLQHQTSHASVYKPRHGPDILFFL